MPIIGGDYSSEHVSNMAVASTNTDESSISNIQASMHGVNSATTLSSKEIDPPHRFSFYMDKHLGNHLVQYIKVIKSSFTNKNEK